MAAARDGASHLIAALQRRDRWTVVVAATASVLPLQAISVEVGAGVHRVVASRRTHVATRAATLVAAATVAAVVTAVRADN
ncbi:hypothetical protein EON62_00240 [archaeon]|nr:MAG: hypothetical protein EON62_00240 [archaeon]